MDLDEGASCHGGKFKPMTHVTLRSWRGDHGAQVRALAWRGAHLTTAQLGGYTQLGI